MQRIRRQIEEGRRFLVIELIGGKADLMKRDDVFQRPGGPGLVQFAIVDIAGILEKFDNEAPPREEFTLTEVATMAQENGPTVNSWVKAGIVTPSIRGRDGTRGRAMLFGRQDAFVACLVASLKRKCGLPLSKLQNVGDVFRPDDDSSTPQEPRRSGTKHKSTKKGSRDNTNKRKAIQ